MEEVKLSKQQLEVSELLKRHPECSILMPSIAGSGKTTTIMNLSNFLVQEMKVDPSQIMLATYTSSAGANMKKKSNHQFYAIDTFHSISNIILGQQNLLKMDQELYQCDEQLRQLAMFLLSDCKASKQLRSKIKYFFVDEYQDNNALMNSVMKSFHRSGTMIIAVGDLNQAIMQFQGGSSKYMLRFQNDFAPCKIHQLSVNYRCSTPIVRLARAIKSHGFLHPEINKEMDLSAEEQYWIDHNIPIEKRITKAMLPRLRHYYNKDQMIQYACEEIQHKLSYNKPHLLVMQARNNDTLKKCRALLLKMGIPCILLRKLTNQNKSKSRKEAAGNIVESGELSEGKVVLTTVHSAKGIEWDDGVILEFHDEIFPSIREGDLQLERNLAYTGITRFRKNLTIFNFFPQTSTFLLELERDGTIQSLFYNCIANFPNESMHLDSELLVNENDVDLENVIELKKKNAGKLIQAVTHWISNLNGCSYMHLKRYLLPYPLSVEIKNIPELYSLPSKIVVVEEKDEMAMEMDDDMEHYDPCEEVSENESDEKLVDEIDYEEDGNLDIEPFNHSEWVERECLEEEIVDFCNCWTIRFVQQLRLDYNLDEKVKEYRFLPAEELQSDVTKKSTQIDLSRLKIMYTMYANKFKNINCPWSSILTCIYWTSVFTGLQSGNLGQLYIQMSDSRLLYYKIMLDEVSSVLHYLIYGNKKYTQNGLNNEHWQLESFFHISGLRKPQPFVLVGNRLILWGYETSEFGAFPQETVIKALIYAAIYNRILGRNIEFVHVYQVFNRKICTVNITDWNLELQKEFLVYLQTTKRDVYEGFEDNDKMEILVKEEGADYSPESSLLISPTELEDSSAPSTKRKDTEKKNKCKKRKKLSLSTHV